MHCVSHNDQLVPRSAVHNAVNSESCLRTLESRCISLHTDGTTLLPLNIHPSICDKSLHRTAQFFTGGSPNFLLGRTCWGVRLCTAHRATIDLIPIIGTLLWPSPDTCLCLMRNSAGTRATSLGRQPTELCRALDVACPQRPEAVATPSCSDCTLVIIRVHVHIAWFDVRRCAPFEFLACCRPGRFHAPRPCSSIRRLCYESIVVLTIFMKPSPVAFVCWRCTNIVLCLDVCSTERRPSAIRGFLYSAAATADARWLLALPSLCLVAYLYCISAAAGMMPACRSSFSGAVDMHAHEPNTVDWLSLCALVY